jgi:hypothetical protein
MWQDGCSGVRPTPMLLGGSVKSWSVFLIWLLPTCFKTPFLHQKDPFFILCCVITEGTKRGNESLTSESSPSARTGQGDRKRSPALSAGFHRGLRRLQVLYACHSVRKNCALLKQAHRGISKEWDWNSMYLHELFCTLYIVYSICMYKNRRIYKTSHLFKISRLKKIIMRAHIEHGSYL